MKDVAVFEKLSFEEYFRDLVRIYPNHDWSIRKHAEEIYREIRLPQRRTKDSGSYWFFTPFDFLLVPGSTVLIPTGIRCRILKEDISLFLFPDSKAVTTSVGLSNGVQIVNKDNLEDEVDGHIYIYLDFPCNWNTGYPRTPLFGTPLEKVNQPIKYIAGDCIAQGSFLEYGIIKDDAPIVEPEPDAYDEDTDPDDPMVDPTDPDDPPVDPDPSGDDPDPVEPSGDDPDPTDPTDPENPDDPPEPTDPTDPVDPVEPDPVVDPTDDPVVPPANPTDGNESGSD